jgi:hypothetical protein
MDAFWAKTKVFAFDREHCGCGDREHCGCGEHWDVRSANIEAMVRLQVERKAAEQLFRRSTRPAPFTVDRPGRESEVSCLELGTYCGYSTLLIARNLEEGSIGPGPPGAVKRP